MANDLSALDSCLFSSKHTHIMLKLQRKMNILELLLQAFVRIYDKLDVKDDKDGNSR